MGGCFSNERGGQQAVGGTQQAPMAAEVNDTVGYFFRSRGQYPLFTQIELSLSASKLRDRDLISKSDPLAIVYAKKKDGTLEELGRTEVIMNSLDPVWIEKTTVSYQFEIVQPMVFHVYDVDTKYYNVPAKMLKLKDQQFLGEATCFLSEIVTKQNRSLTLSLHRVHEHPNVNNLGTITVRAEETVSERKSVEMTLRCSCLENKDLLSKIDPFLRISRVVEDGGFIPVCRTEVVNNNLNPTWRPLCLSMQQFGDQNTPLVIECFNFKSSGNHILIGKLQKSIAELGKLYRDKIGANFVFPSSVQHGREKVLKGQLYVENFCEKTLFSFIDYISNGFELNFMVAIDFTASNGHPQQLNSLHYIDPSGRANAYQQAIMGVGEVLQFYDSDKLFPTWGFGGRLHDGSVSHCFNLNGHSSGYEAAGMDGVMVAYANALHTFPLAGPTLFGPVINRAAQIASESCNEKKYFVLLIITDGVLSDLQETIDALVEASGLPLSILIVGVGSADFKAMEILDADNGNRLESSTGRIATRDIVQFVPMREVHAGQVSVIQALLEELPGQFLTHMRSRDIKPHPLI